LFPNGVAAIPPLGSFFQIGPPARIGFVSLRIVNCVSVSKPGDNPKAHARRWVRFFKSGRRPELASYRKLRVNLETRRQPESPCPPLGSFFQIGSPTRFGFVS
jgi:hypothetical protein